MKFLGNVLLFVLSIVLAGAIAEAATRMIDGLPVFTDWLPQTVDRDLSSASVDSIKRAPGVERAWFFQDPPPLPNRRRPPEEWKRLMEEIGEGTGEKGEKQLVLRCPFASFGTLQSALEAKGITPVSAEAEYIPQTPVELTEEQATEVLELVDALEQDDDVQKVFHNLA